VSTASETILARYAKIEREADDFGRMIGVKRLRSSEVTKVDEMSPGLDGVIPVTDSDTGKIVEIPKRSRLYVAASVREIDGNAMPFPRNRAELDAVVDALDDEGFIAASKALGRLAPSNNETGTETAKNSPGTSD
jgi:hypothetical protein